MAPHSSNAPTSWASRLVTGIACLGALACTVAPPGPRLIAVRPGSIVTPAGAGELVDTVPAATPTFPTLTLGPDGRSEPHLINGWRRTPEGLSCRGPASEIRFWVGEPRPIRIRLRGHAAGGDAGASRRLIIDVGSNRAGEVVLPTGGFDLSLEVPGGVLRPGTNQLAIGRPRVREGTHRRRPAVSFEEIVLEDAEDPRPVATPVVELDVEGLVSPLRGLWVDRPGRLVFLLHPPDTADELELGFVCRGALAGARPSFRAEVAGDQGRETLVEGEAAEERLRWYRASLGGFAGAPMRLSLEIEHVPSGAGCAIVEPRVGRARAATSPPSPGKRAIGANLIVIILDAAARDHFGLYGSKEGTTDAIDALAGESVVFDRAYTQASYTLASTASLFTGRLPVFHRVTRSNLRKAVTLPEAMPTLAGVLGEAGYDTAMFTGNPNTSSYEVARGFDEVFELFRLHPGVARAEGFRRPALDWVDRLRDSPFLLYLHYVQPHEPFDVAPSRFYRGLDPNYRGVFSGKGARGRSREDVDAEDLKYLRQLYDGNLRYPDEEVGRLVASLRERGVLDESVLVLSSDHGESLGERGAFRHGHGVDRELVPIPLLIRLPSRLGVTGRRSSPVGNVDVMPTLLDLVGVSVPDSLDGTSFRHLLDGEDLAGWPRTIPAWAGGDRATTVAVYGAGYKYVFDSRTGRERLFTAEEQEDGEDVRVERPVTFGYLAFSSYLPGRSGSDDAPEDEGTRLDPQSVEALRALGYVE